MNTVFRSSSGASGGGRGSSVDFYGPRIEYSYEVDGRQYTNRQISAVVIRSINRPEVEKFLADFPADAEVDVFITRKIHLRHTSFPAQTKSGGGSSSSGF